MLRCAASFIIAAYPKVRFIPQDLRALPADFLQSRPKNRLRKTKERECHPPHKHLAALTFTLPYGIMSAAQ